MPLTSRLSALPAGRGAGVHWEFLPACSHAGGRPCAQHAFLRWTEVEMPYTPKQCRLFGARSGRGGSVPDDWQDHCRKGSEPGGSKAKPRAGKRPAKRRPGG